MDLSTLFRVKVGENTLCLHMPLPTLLAILGQLQRSIMPAQLSGLCWGDGGMSLDGFLRYQGLCHHQGSGGR